jgi:hypothetical protein
MLTSYLESHVGSYRWVFLVAAVVAVGCRGGNEISCPAVLESCPATPPTSGAPCAARGPAAACEYGEDPYYYCDPIAVCDLSMTWYVPQTDASALGCPTTLPSACPPTFAGLASGQTACAPAPERVTCRYPEGTCYCAPNGDVSCTAPAAAGCPATRPRAGTACSAPCTTWGSGTCDGQSMKCVCGVWQPVQCTL